MKELHVSKLFQINIFQALNVNVIGLNNFLFTGICLYITALETIVLPIRCVSERAC